MASNEWLQILRSQEIVKDQRKRLTIIFGGEYKSLLTKLQSLASGRTVTTTPRPFTRQLQGATSMRSRRFSITVGAVALTLALPVLGGADDKGKDKDKDTQVLTDAVVQFAHLVTPAPPAGSLAGTLTHFLNPDDVTIRKGGTVTFVVNNGGHGIAIYPVDKKTTRDDIAEDLCQGPPGTAESDRAARFTVCGGPQANLNYDITDAKGDLIIRTGANVNNSNPRVDDPTNRLLGTSGRVPTCGPGQTEPTCDSSVLAANAAGGFLAGNVLANPNLTPPILTPTIGNRIVYRFNKTGRYLVICMNRAHSLNDHMFGFVNVVGDGDDDDK